MGISELLRRGPLAAKSPPPRRNKSIIDTMKQTIRQRMQKWAAGAGAPGQAVVFFAVLLVVSMPLSPFLLSISMWGLVFATFWRLCREGNTSWPGIRTVWVILEGSFRNFFRQRQYAVLFLLLLAPALSGLWSEDQAYWLERTRVRLPFLVLPWVFANLPPLSGRQFRLVLYLLTGLMVALCVGVGVYFFLHFKAVMQAMYWGQSMPAPRNHIRFSLLVATAVIAGGWLWQERYFWRSARERRWLAVAVVFLFVFAHFLSVRSGLAALYATLLFTLIRFIWRTRRWATALLLLALLAFAPWLAMKTMPSFAQKVDYMAYDWRQYLEHKGESYSDAERWISLKTGWYIWQERPWLGAGAGDLPAETARVVRLHFPSYQQTPKLPHNQILYILAGTGLFGLALSLLAFVYPLALKPYRGDYLFVAFQVMMFCSFLVEYTIETAMGVAWYLFFTLWFMKRAETEIAPGIPPYS